MFGILPFAPGALKSAPPRRWLALLPSRGHHGRQGIYRSAVTGRVVGAATCLSTSAGGSTMPYSGLPVILEARSKNRS